MNILLFLYKIRKRRGGDLNSCGADAPRAFQDCPPSVAITQQQLEEFLSLREIEGSCNDWIKGIQRYLLRYLTYVDWKADREKTIQYLTLERGKCNISTYRKKVLQIRKFLMYCGYQWVQGIKPPQEPEIIIKHISPEAIQKTLRIVSLSKESVRYNALILLGATSGLRSEELYQLTPEDIDLNNRTIHVVHNPLQGKTTKTKHSRISFFTIEAQQALSQYLKSNTLSPLFPKGQCIQALKQAPIRVKDLRKYFSQSWDRSCGPTSVKKLLMGHSLRGDIDLSHYNNQSPEELRGIYDKVMDGASSSI